MKRWVKAGIYCILVIALIVGLALPTVMAYIQDSQTDQVVQRVSATSVQLDLGTATTLLQKYRMAENTDSSIKLDNAQKMDEEQALGQLTAGLEVLFGPEDEEIPFTAEGFYEVNYTVRLMMEGEDSMIYWDFLMENDQGDRISAAVDDDTGVIIYLKYTLNTDPAEGQRAGFDLMKRQPLFLNPNDEGSAGGIISADGIFGNLEETGYSAEDFTRALQEDYCDIYLGRKGYRFSWEPGDSGQSGSSYYYSVMLVNNQGGYYVLTFSVSNDEIVINP